MGGGERHGALLQFRSTDLAQVARGLFAESPMKSPFLPLFLFSSVASEAACPRVVPLCLYYT